jgi:hypothetical protein
MGLIRPAGDQFKWGSYGSEPLTQLSLGLDDVFEPVYPTPHILARVSQSDLLNVMLP